MACRSCLFKEFLLTLMKCSRALVYRRTFNMMELCLVRLLNWRQNGASELVLEHTEYLVYLKLNAVNQESSLLILRSSHPYPW